MKMLIRHKLINAGEKNNTDKVDYYQLLNLAKR